MKRGWFWLWSVSRSLSFKTYDLPKTKRRESCPCFRLLSLSRIFTFIAQTTRRRRRRVRREERSRSFAAPVVSLTRRRERKKIGLNWKNSKMWDFCSLGNHNNKLSSIQRGRRVSVSLDHYRNDRERCTDKDMYDAPCSTSSSPWSRLGRIGSGQNRCFVTSTPPKKRARNPSLATRTRWRCTQSSHRWLNP